MEKTSLKFVFWNIHKKLSNIDLISRYGELNGIDIIALCEVPDLEGREWPGYKVVPHVENYRGLEVLVRAPMEVYYARELTRYCLLRIQSNHNINFVVAHLNSDLNSSGSEYRVADIGQIKEHLSIEEMKSGNKNSLIVGDFNENIFSDSIVGWNGFNVKFFKSTIRDGIKKRHDAQQQDIFYSPMLQVYKDSCSPVSAKGTYYYASSDLEWLCFDQVLMKKPLADMFDERKLKIIDSLCGIPLVNNNRPKKEICDHLPIYFEIGGEK